jgi:hypothetical protein
VKPSEAFEAIADAITETVKRPYRDEDIAPNEWDVITDRILEMARRDKAKYAVYHVTSQGGADGNGKAT